MAIIEFLKLWIKDIAMVFILISIIEIVLPNSNLKRYIDMVTGLIIILVIISPFAKLILKDFDIDREVFNYSLEQTRFENRDNLNLSILQEEQIKEVYTNKLKEDIKNLAHEGSSYKVENITLSLYEDEVNYGKIKNIELILSENSEENGEKERIKDRITVTRIEEISVGNKKQFVSEIKELEDEKIIKNLISQNYNIPKSSIRIFLNTIKEDEWSGEIN